MNESTHNGSIITWESQDIQGRHEIHIYGRGPEGPFKLIIDNNQPLFFVTEEALKQNISYSHSKALELKNFQGEPVWGLYFNSLRQFYSAREELRRQNITHYESDVYPADRFLMERFINNGIEWRGTGMWQNDMWIFRNPQIKAIPHYKPAYKVISLDIETGQNGQIYSIAMHGYGYNMLIDDYHKVIIHSDHGGGVKDGYQYCRGEKETLLCFLSLLQRWDPDIIIGWYVIGFDLQFLQRRCDHYNIPFLLGRGKSPVTMSEQRGGFSTAELKGRIVLDGIQVLKQNFFKYESYKLENVAQDLLGRGKDISDDSDKVAEIERRYREDPEALARYNLEDCQLVSDIFNKAELLDLLVARREMTGMALDHVSRTIASFDHFYLPRIHRQGFVTPNVNDIIPGEAAMGGHVFSDKPGIYEDVIVLDFKSLYPTIIRTFHIDPLSLLLNYKDPLTCPVGTKLSRTHSILPDFLEDLMKKREDAKEQGNKHLSMAIKILMNSFYGAMGTMRSRFYNHQLPTAITGTGQWILKTAQKWLQDEGYQVIYGDTDSVFVCLKDEQKAHADEESRHLAERINHFFETKIMEVSSVFSHLEIEYEKHFSRFFLPPLRGSETGARKRYAGIHKQGRLETLEFTGMEYVRSDWTELARGFQFDLYTILLKSTSQEDRKNEVTLWIKNFITELFEGRHDDELMYKKGLSKSPQEYTKNVPPHVKAALQLPSKDQKYLRKIEYLMTRFGPQAKGYIKDEPDYEHYLDRQIRPLAEDVLPYMGLQFEELISGKQLDLF